jgi:hypothetical protein
LEKTDVRSKLRQALQTGIACLESRFKQWTKPDKTNQVMSTLAGHEKK